MIQNHIQETEKKQSTKFMQVLLVLCFLFGFSCNSKQDKEEEPVFIDSPINKGEYFAIVQNNSIYLYGYSV